MFATNIIYWEDKSMAAPLAAIAGQAIKAYAIDKATDIVKDKVVDGSVNKAKDIYRNFSKKCKDISWDLKQNSIQINADDSLADKTFFAFLADLLNGFKKNKGNTLMDELKDNENLTRDRLEKLLESELEANESLTNSVKQGIRKFLESEDNKEFATDLLGNKIKEINDFRAKAQELGMSQEELESKILKDSKFDIIAKNVQALTAGEGKDVVKDAPNKTQESIKHIINKNIRKS